MKSTLTFLDMLKPLNSSSDSFCHLLAFGMVIYFVCIEILSLFFYFSFHVTTLLFLMFFSVLLAPPLLRFHFSYWFFGFVLPCWMNFVCLFFLLLSSYSLRTPSPSVRFIAVFSICLYLASPCRFVRLFRFYLSQDGCFLFRVYSHTFSSK